MTTAFVSIIQMPRFIDVVTRLLSFALGLYLSVGGTMGFVHAKSIASLVTGIVFGIPLVLTATLGCGQKAALIASAMAAGFFGSRYSQNHEMFPAGYGAIASVVVALLNCMLLPDTSVKRD